VDSLVPPWERAGSPVLAAWLVSRLLVLLGLLIARLVHPGERDSLLAWDAAWYRDIAVLGYQSAPAGAVRFFPVWPLLGRALGVLPLVAPGAALVVVANVAALVYLTLGQRLAREVGLDERTVRRVPWVLALAPGSVVLVMGYTEALFGVLTALVLLGARRGRWWACAAAGIVAGALRPTGVVLLLPVLLEAARRGRPAAGRTELLSRLAAVLAPAAGLGLFLAWSWQAYGDALAPFHAQLDPQLRGGLMVGPLTTLRDVPHLVHWRDIVSLLLNAAAVVASIPLLVVAVRRLPASFAALGVATVALALTARDFASYERYVGSAVPLLLAAAIILGRRSARPPRTGLVAGLAVGGLVLLGQATLIFSDLYVP
jgi:hypothetical protein